MAFNITEVVILTAVQENFFTLMLCSNISSLQLFYIHLPNPVLKTSFSAATWGNEKHSVVKTRIESWIYSNNYWKRDKSIHFGMNILVVLVSDYECWFSLYQSFPCCFIFSPLGSSSSFSHFISLSLVPWSVFFYHLLVVPLCLRDNFFLPAMYWMVIFRPITIAPDSSGLDYIAVVTFSHCTDPFFWND